MSKSFGNGEKNLWVPTQKHDFQALKWWPDAVGMALLSVLCQFGTVLQETIYGHIVKIKFEDRAKTYLPTVFFSRKGNYDYNIQCWDFNCTMFAVNKHKSRSNVWRTHGSVRILRFKRFSNLPLSEKKNLICHLNKTMRLCIIQARIFVFSRKILLSSESSKKSVMLMLQHLLHAY